MRNIKAVYQKQCRRNHSHTIHYYTMDYFVKSSDLGASGSADRALRGSALSRSGPTCRGGEVGGA
jgi:hypothetical protein